MKVEFFPEVICSKHKRVAPTCSDCQARHYEIDEEREIDGLPIDSVTTILKQVGDKFGAGAWWGQGIGVEAVAELVRRGLLRWEE